MDFRVVATGLKFPEGPLILPNGDLLVTEIAAHCLTRITPDGTKSVFATTGGGPIGAASGQVWRGNFFKCAEDISHPHWAAWSPVDEFNFHLPRCFGAIQLA